MTPRALVLPALLVSLGACCAPDGCAPARDGFAALAPATEAILSYQARTGHLPASLADAGVVPPSDTPDGADLAFRSRGTLVPVRWEPVDPDATRGEWRLTFRYDVPGRNVCDWTAGLGWRCWGYL